MAPVRSSAGASAIVTQSFCPSKTSAPPYRPAVVQVAPLTVPVWPRPDASAVVGPWPSPNAHAPTSPDGTDVEVVGGDATVELEDEDDELVDVEDDVAVLEVNGGVTLVDDVPPAGSELEVDVDELLLVDDVDVEGGGAEDDVEDVELVLVVLLVLVVEGAGAPTGRSRSLAISACVRTRS